jgi:hypothetical protein
MTVEFVNRGLTVVLLSMDRAATEEEAWTTGLFYWLTFKLGEGLAMWRLQFERVLPPNESRGARIRLLTRHHTQGQPVMSALRRFPTEVLLEGLEDISLCIRMRFKCQLIG